MSDRDVIFISMPHRTTTSLSAGLAQADGLRVQGLGRHLRSGRRDAVLEQHRGGVAEADAQGRLRGPKPSCDPNRSGVQNEISVADAVKKSLKDPDFIIPVRIDDIAFSDLPIQIHRLNAVDFTTGWGAKLAELVDTLTKAGVPRAVTDLSAEFDRWRQASVRSDVVVERGEEPLLTSIMPIIRLPEEVSFYEYDGENKKFEQALETVPHPYAMHNRLLVSFAAAHEIQAHLPPELTVSLRGTASFATFLEGKVTDPVGPQRRDANAWAVRMLRESFEAHLASRGLLRYVASAGTVMFFPKDLLADDRVYYTNAKGKRTYNRSSARARCSTRTGISACERSFASVKRPRTAAPVRRLHPGRQDAAAGRRENDQAAGALLQELVQPRVATALASLLRVSSAQVPRACLSRWANIAVGPSRRRLKLTAGMRMPFDLDVVDEEGEPEEPDDADDDGDEFDEGMVRRGRGMTAAWRAIHIDEPRLSFGTTRAPRSKGRSFLFGPVASARTPRVWTSVSSRRRPVSRSIRSGSRRSRSSSTFRRRRRTASETTPTPSSGLASRRSTRRLAEQAVRDVHDRRRRTAAAFLGRQHQAIYSASHCM